jgi:hypothetical protein
MMFVVLLAVTAMQKAGEEPAEKLVDRLVAGQDVSSRIRALGPGAFQVLRPRRDSARVREVIRAIREAAASSEDRKLSSRLSALTVKFDGGRTTFGQAVETLVGDGVRFAIDPRESEVIAACEVTPPKSGSSLDVLEELCAQAGADFAFLYGVVVVARPDRLWPPLPPRARPLSEDEKARARALVAKLGSESPEERDRVEVELRRFGPPVMPVLETGASDRDPEIAGRCRALAEELRPRPSRVFGPAAVERQRLAGDDAALWVSLKGKLTTYKVKDLLLENNLMLLLSQVEGGSLRGGVPRVKLTFSFENVPFAAILAIVTQCAGLDYVIEDGHVVVGPQEELLRRLPPGK